MINQTLLENSFFQHQQRNYSTKILTFQCKCIDKIHFISRVELRHSLQCCLLELAQCDSNIICAIFVCGESNARGFIVSVLCFVLRHCLNRCFMGLVGRVMREWDHSYLTHSSYDKILCRCDSQFFSTFFFVLCTAFIFVLILFSRNVFVNVL